MRVRNVGPKVLLTSKYGVSIEYDGKSMFNIEMPSSYVGCTEGNLISFSLTLIKPTLCVTLQRSGWEL